MNWLKITNVNLGCGPRTNRPKAYGNHDKPYKRNALCLMDPKIGSQAPPLGLLILHQQNTARSSGIGKVEKYPKG